MVMQRIANPSIPVRFRTQPPINNAPQCPGGEIGRRKGLKIPRMVTSVPVRLRLWALLSIPLKQLTFFSDLFVYIAISSTTSKIKLSTFALN